MSTATGVSVSEGLRAAFDEAYADDDILFIKVEIGDDGSEFVVSDRGTKTSDDTADWKEVQDFLDDTEPCYVLLNRRDSANWIVIVWVPPRSESSTKLLYAQSREALRSGLGSGKFDDDYSIQAKDSCEYSIYQASVKTPQVDENKDAWTPEETNRLRARIETAPTKVKSQVIHGLSVPFGDSVSSGFDSLKNGASNLLVLRLTRDPEELVAEDSTNVSIDEIEGLLERHVQDEVKVKEPRFLVYRYDHSRDGENVSKTLYLYFCPESATAKWRTFYSFAKSEVIALGTELGVSSDGQLELSLPSEASKENFEFKLYPKVEEVKRFKKPSAPGRGRARIHRGRKK